MIERLTGHIVLCAVLVLLLLSVGTACGAADRAGWTLVWSDEFNGPNGTPPDSTKWRYEIGGGGWGNDELEYYTDRIENSFQENGNLVIRALKENYKGRHYTSARLLTRETFAQAYGRFEARIKIPTGKGLWPAFWMLGSDFDKKEDNWPDCGEIDIMENIGSEPSAIHGSMHGPGYYDDKAITGSFSFADYRKFSADYHVFAVEWDKDKVRFFVDQNNYETITKQEVLSYGKWVFDKPFFILLNVAVGGEWPGKPGQATVFPQSMLVDYVRVYKKQERPEE
ncbi:MAG: glycoside hydrolase family 16 protein [Negativicutes bacterium]|nr:glycoside hydrolase family 16 protein [Negativicutes bacterium]